MAEVRHGRWTAEIDGDFVVFIIGARINSKLQTVRALSDLGGRRGMNYMLKYLTERPEKGLLGYQNAGFTVIQYWRSFEHLEAFAKNTDDPHLETWRTLLAPHRQEHPDRHLARDVPGPRRRVRGDLREHASPRAREGGHARARCGVSGRTRATQGGVTWIAGRGALCPGRTWGSRESLVPLHVRDRFHALGDGCSDRSTTCRTPRRRGSRACSAPYGSALDLGCGTGRWSVELARRGWHVVSVDVVPKAIRAAQRHALDPGVDVEFIEVDVTALRSAGVGSGFSFLLDVECFNHLNDSQRGGCRPGGQRRRVR